MEPACAARHASTLFFYVHAAERELCSLQAGLKENLDYLFSHKLLAEAYKARPPAVSIKPLKGVRLSMKEVLHTKKFKTLLFTVLILFGVSIFSGNGGLVASALSIFSVPTQRVSTLVSNNAYTAAENAAASKDDLLAENRALRERISELETQLVDYYDLKKENAQLYKYLDMKQENPDFKPVAASVIGKDPNTFYCFTIDQGTNAGISVNDPVVTDEGVVGWVSAVNSISAKVTTLLSPDTKIGGLTESGASAGATDKVTGDSGVIGTNIKLSDQGLIKLQYLTAETKAKAGDIVVTSGLGGLYPSNLKIGRITSVEHEEYDVSLYALVEPFVDVTTLRDVMVLTEFDGQGEILSAGDSSSNAGSASSSGASSSSSSPASSNAASSSENSPASSGSSTASSR
ncbi:MAG: rod shape-determining protein MreC [Hydrogeniiclostridium sp.]